MKWSEIKQAIEQSGIREDDEILEIRCELGDGDKRLHPVKQGDFLRLNEYLSEEALRKESTGCAI